jgi:hypothetical protein
MAQEDGDVLSVPYSPGTRRAASGLGYLTCGPCAAAGDSNPKGPVHRQSRELWVRRRDRALHHNGVDPVSGASAALAMWHLDLLGTPVAGLSPAPSTS